jgi:hypothetical protein
MQATDKIYYTRGERRRLNEQLEKAYEALSDLQNAFEHTPSAEEQCYIGRRIDDLQGTILNLET